MKFLNKKWLYSVSLVTVCLFLILPMVMYAQPGLPSDTEQNTPIDGGLSILAVAGGAYAVRKLRDKSKE